MLTIEEKTFRAQLISALKNLTDAIEKQTDEIKKLNENFSRNNSRDTEA